MITIYTHQNGSTRSADRVDPAWLRADSGVTVWVDLNNPSPDEAKVLADVFHFHELAIEDALDAIHHPKVESYGTYLYVILHGIDFSAREHRFRTQDIDFFLAPNFLVTVHHGASRSVGRMQQICTKNEHVLGEGPAALMHRIVDVMIDNYRPEVQKLEDRLDKLEAEVFGQTRQNFARRILDYKRDIASLRRVVQPEREVVGRLARREFPVISEPIAFRYRDVYDHLVRLNDESLYLQDRVVSLLDAHLSTVSNQLNSVMKVLTVIATIFMPLTFITGLYGMNVGLPHFGLGDQTLFWGLLVAMLMVSGGMLMVFRHRNWM